MSTAPELEARPLRPVEAVAPTSPTFPTKGIVKRLAEAVFGLEANLARAWASAAHRRLLKAQWALQPAPEWFDHSIDLMHKWTASGESYWVERGVYSSLALKGGRVLDLACGDGFMARHFYAGLSTEVVACDFDPDAIRTARRKNPAANVTYVLADIRTDMPQGRFENVTWDAAIEHFTPAEIDSILRGIKERLTPDGVLSGYTIVERDDGVRHIHQHEYEFRSMADLRRFLTPWFRNVRVFETVHPARHNLYFWASDGPVPFDHGWRP